MAINKVKYGDTTLIDLTGTTATADKILTGYGAYGRDGVWMDGSATGGGVESVTQDENGYVVLDDESGTLITVDPLSVTQNGTYTAPTGHAYSPVTVNVSGGGGDDEGKDVNFYDYDGTLLHSYTAQEFAQLSELPRNPSHSGLVAQGWNWTKAEITEQLESAIGGTVDVGQMYVTESGMTEIDIEFNDPDYLSPYLMLQVNGSITVDWGDNSQTTITGTSLSITQPKITNHTYAQTGTYTIKIGLNSGQYSLGGYSADYSGILQVGNSISGNKNRNCVYSNLVSEVRFGSSLVLQGLAFNNFHSLRYVTMSTGTSFLQPTPNSFFQKCYMLEHVTLPRGISAIPRVFNMCFSLKSVSIPFSVTTITDQAFYQCYSLKNITIPKGITEVTGFQQCYSMEKVIFPRTPVDVPIICGAFSSTKITSIYLPSRVSTLGIGAFRDTRLKSVIIENGNISLGTGANFQINPELTSVSLPEGMLEIPSNMFSGCYSLEKITLPTTITSIGSSAFSTNGLIEITIPSNVQSIGNSAFSNCYGLKEVHLLPTTPPTLGGTSVFSGITSYTTIYVPRESLEAYQTATNWTSYASYMVGE